MVRKTFSIQAFLVVMVLMLQLVFPIGQAIVSANTGILPPSNLAYQSTTIDDGKLTWSAVFGATRYKVYEIKDGQLILLGSTTVLSYTLSNLSEGSHRYVVSTVTSEGESGPSAPVTADIVYPELQAPATLNSTIRNGNDIVLSWGASQYAQKYNIYQTSESGERTLVTSTTATTYTKVNAAEGLYTYSVSAYHAIYGESPETTPIKVEVIYPEMKQPSNLSFTIANGTDVNLKWQAASYATSYKIYEDIEGRLELKGTVTGTSVTFGNLPAGDYTYKVYSYSDRFGESAEGSQVSLTVGSIAMAPPSNVTYNVQNINDVVLNWGAVPYATSYKVYELNNGERTLKSTVTGTTVTYSMLKGGNYEYEIYSYSDRFGESGAGSKVSFSIDTVKIYPPAEIAYKIQNGNDIVLNWSASENATNYKIYQIIDGQKVLKKTVTGTSTTFADMPAENYQFEVHTNSTRFGESEDGAQISFTLEQVNLSAPGNAKYEIKNGNDIALSWDSVEYATNYKIYQVIDGKKVLKSTVASPAATFTNLPEGDALYEIYSYSSRFGESKEGASVKISLVYPEMTAPANVIRTTVSPTSFTLSWNPVEYATSYKVYQIVDGQKVLKNNVTGTTASYSNMQPGVYKYEVYSYSTRFGESQEGTPIEVTLSGQALAAPGNLSYSISNGNDITLKWDTVQYATSYKVYQMFAGVEVLKGTVTGTKITLANMPEGEFNFVVKAYSSLLGESPNGAEINGSIAFPIMVKPQNLKQSISNGNDITLTWSTVPYAKAYNIYQIIDGEKVLKGTVTELTTTFTNMSEGNYQYVVHSYSDRFGESPEGSTLEFNLTWPIMQAPGNLTKTTPNGNDIALKWNATAYAKEYRIYEIVDGEKVLKRTVKGTSTTFTNMPEGNYQYMVHSYSDRFGESPEGSKLEFNLTWPIMQAPGNFTKTIANGNDIALKWNTTPYTNEYRVYQIVDGEKVLRKTVTEAAATFTNMPEGDYEYIVHSYSDRFGESLEGSKLAFNLTWPIVAAPTVSGSVFNANNITLSWKAVTWATGYRVYKVNGEDRELIYKGTALSYKVYNLTEGNHSFEVTAYSSRFGESAPSERLDQQIVYPVMEPPTASLKLLSETSAQISWNLVTYANGYNVYEVVDGKPVLLVQNLNNLSYVVQNLSYANHEYYVTAYSNSFGESKPSETVIAKLILDTQAPETKSNTPTKWVNQSQLITLEATDNEVGVANTFYSLNDGPFQEGTSILVDQEGSNKISFYSIDKVGNKEEVKTEFVKIDKTAPSTSSEVLDTWVNKDVTVTLKAEDASSGVSKTYYSINGSEYTEGSSFVVEKEGINTISYYSIDAAGNKEEVTSKEVKIDKTAPTTSSDAPEAWVNKGVTVTLKAEDGNSGVSKTYYSINGSEYAEGTSFVVEKEGINTISYYSIDAAGNKEEVTSKEVKIDKTAPTTSSDAPEAWVNKEVTVTLRAEDGNSGVSKTYYSINGSEYTEGTSFVVEKEGINAISYYSIDAAGNKEEVTSKEVKIDKTAPTTSSDAPEAWVNKEVTVMLAAEDEISGVSKTYYSINGSEYAEGISFVVEKEGINTISYYSIDAAGNKEEVQSKEVKIDKTAPTTSSDAPEAWVNKGVTVTLAAEDTNSGVSKMYYSINGSEYAEGNSFVVEKEGINTISYYSIDAAGNKEEVKSKEVKIDKTAPTTSSDAPEAWVNKEVTVTLRAEDGNSGVAKTYYSINGSEYAGGNSFVVEKEGINTISYYSIDTAGNKEEVQSKEIKIDKTAPTVSVDWEEEYKLGTSFTLDYDANDNLSGVAVEEVTLNGEVYKKGDKITLGQPGEYKLSIKVTDAAGLSTVVEKTFIVYIPVTLEVLPKVIKGNKGIFTVKATLPAGYESFRFDVPSVKLNGVSAAADNKGLQNQAEKGQFKFNREDFVWATGEVSLEFRGYVDNKFLVVGKTTVEVKK